MEHTALHPLPNHFAVAREQLLSVGIKQRRELLLMGVLALVLVGLAVYALLFAEQTVTATENGREITRTYRGATNADLGELLKFYLLPVSLLGLLWPLSVWNGEGPRHRVYHWAMPVRRDAHSLLRTAAGWVWLMAAVAGLLLLMVLVAAITGNLQSLGDETLIWWVRPFTAATLLYLLASVAALWTDYPGRWLVGIIIGYGLLLPTLFSLHVDREIVETLASALDGRLGLGTALSGEIEVPMQITRNGRVFTGTKSVLDAGAWAMAWLLWTGIGTAGVLFASSRHLER